MHANEDIVHVFLTTPLRYVVYGLHFFFPANLSSVR